jgi:hypothetical protein
MKKLPTVLLHHTTPTGSHYDWMLLDPQDADDDQVDHALWTARCPHPADAWLGLEKFDLEALPPHRRCYLTFQGPLTGDRGHVQQVDQGWFTPSLWTATQIHLELHLQSGDFLVQLLLIRDNRWQAEVRQG